MIAQSKLVETITWRKVIVIPMHLLLMSSLADAAAAKRNAITSSGASKAPQFSTPKPVRKVVVKPFGSKVFHLPNGNAIDISADLQSILMTVVTDTEGFSPTESVDSEPCESHLEIRSNMTVFQLDVADFGISFGFSKAGEFGPITGLNSSSNTQIGSIAMDFSIWKCAAGNCTAVSAATASYVTTGVQSNFDMDFNSIKFGPSFVYNTVLADAFRKVMTAGIMKLDQSTRLSELPWQARVKNYDANAGMLIFDAGTQFRLGPNQAFEVYAPIDNSPTGMCNVFQTVAYVHTTAVSTASSTAMVDQVLDSRGVKSGDIVMVRTMGH